MSECCTIATITNEVDISLPGSRLGIKTEWPEPLSGQSGRGCRRTSTGSRMAVMTRLTTAICGVWLALIGAAAAAPPDPTPARQPARADPVKEITIDPHAKEPVCRRYTPTGSRIAKRRCETPAAENVRDAERDRLRRDLDEMRTREIMRDQARAQALAESMRRRANQ